MNMDLHKARAAEIFGVPVEQVTPEQRDYAKKTSYVDLYSKSSGMICDPSPTPPTTTPGQTLRYVRPHRNGSIYFHHWLTGWQELVFANEERAAAWAASQGAVFQGPALVGAERVKRRQARLEELRAGFDSKG